MYLLVHRFHWKILNVSRLITNSDSVFVGLFVFSRVSNEDAHAHEQPASAGRLQF